MFRSSGRCRVATGDLDVQSGYAGWAQNGDGQITDRPDIARDSLHETEERRNQEAGVASSISITDSVSGTLMASDSTAGYGSGSLAFAADDSIANVDNVVVTAP